MEECVPTDVDARERPTRRDVFSFFFVFIFTVCASFLGSFLTLLLQQQWRKERVSFTAVSLSLSHLFAGVPIFLRFPSKRCTNAVPSPPPVLRK